MSQHVCMGAMIKCSCGSLPAALMVIPRSLEMSGGPLGASILDNLPMANIPSFGTCCSLQNPAVELLTAANMGALTPGPCLPVTTAPWFPGSPTVLLGGIPVLNKESKLFCAWAGLISVAEPGEFTVAVP